MVSFFTFYRFYFHHSIVQSVFVCVWSKVHFSYQNWASVCVRVPLNVGWISSSEHYKAGDHLGRVFLRTFSSIFAYICRRKWSEKCANHSENKPKRMMLLHTHTFPTLEFEVYRSGQDGWFNGRLIHTLDTWRPECATQFFEIFPRRLGWWIGSADCCGVTSSFHLFFFSLGLFCWFLFCFVRTAKIALNIIIKEYFNSKHLYINIFF